MTLGGTRSGTSAWKSPATGGAADTNILDEPGYPALPADITYDTTHGWEWPVVYEFAVNVAADCGSNPVTVEVISAHNSPSKDGTSDVPVEPIEFVDYGDAPSPYPTLLASNGARHTLLPTGVPILGLIVDADTDGQPNTAATGDDLLDGLDDEDGVTFVADLFPGTTAPIQVAGTAGAKLNAWIDFNDNGVWTDAGEAIATNYSSLGRRRRHQRHGAAQRGGGHHLRPLPREQRRRTDAERAGGQRRSGGLCRHHRRGAP